MATILRISDYHVHRHEKRAEQAGEADIVIFPGVRYERSEEVRKDAAQRKAESL